MRNPSLKDLRDTTTQYSETQNIDGTSCIGIGQYYDIAVSRVRVTAVDDIIL